MNLFHERHRYLLFLSILGGVYLPSLSRIIPWKSVHILLKGYANSLTIGYILICIFAMREMVFLADNIVNKIVSVNNICDYCLAFGRALLFNVIRNQAQALYDLWDVYFTGDGHDAIRKKYLDGVKKLYKKYIICSGTLMHLMSFSWAVEQFTNENCDFSVPIGIPFHNENPEFLIWATFILIMFSIFGPTLITVNLLTMEPITWIAAEFMRLRQSLADILRTIEIRENGEIIYHKNGDVLIISNKRELESAFHQVDKKLKKWIIEHQKLLIFHQKMIAVNHGPLIIQLLCTTIAICIFSFYLASNYLNAFDTFISVLLYLPNYLLFFIISRYGDLVSEQAAGVFDSAFVTNWIIYPKHIQKNLHIIALRTNYPLNINILKKYPLGSHTYFQIVETAYSFYSFLRFLTSNMNS